MTTRGSLDDCLYEMAVPKVPHFDRPALNHPNVYAAGKIAPEIASPG